MPRFPTILLIGSQFISTMFAGCSSTRSPGSTRVAMAPSLLLPPRPVAGRELGALVAPLGLLVDGVVGDAAQLADNGAVGAARGRGDLAAGRLVHEGHELVGEAGHGAGDADAADVGAAADAVHPAALGDIAVADRSPAAQLDEALGRAVLRGKIPLLVIPRAVAALMHGLAEEPGGAQGIVERDHGRH